MRPLAHSAAQFKKGNHLVFHGQAFDCIGRSALYLHQVLLLREYLHFRRQKKVVGNTTFGAQVGVHGKGGLCFEA